MIRYLNWAITFAEVPDEVSLCINITNCPHRCSGCHTPELQQDIGPDLEQVLPALINKVFNDITCVCFMGEGNDPEALAECLEYIKRRGFKTCLYTGGHGVNAPLEWLDYIKTGPYIRALGGLNSPKTNQFMYRVIHKDNGEIKFQNITSRFWPKD